MVSKESFDGASNTALQSANAWRFTARCATTDASARAKSGNAESAAARSIRCFMTTGSGRLELLQATVGVGWDYVWRGIFVVVPQSCCGGGGLRFAAGGRSKSAALRFAFVGLIAD